MFRWLIFLCRNYIWFTSSPRASNFAKKQSQCQLRPKTGVSPEKWPLAWEWKFFWGSSNGKVVAPGIVVICPIDKNRDHYTKNWLLAPNIQIFGSKKHIFAPSGQLELHWSMFSTQKRCLIGLPIWGYQKFYSLPPKNWILGPKTAKFGPKLAFWAKYRHFWPIWSNAWPKNNADKLSWWFSVMLVPKLTPIK